MIKISTKGLYGLKALYELTRHYGGEPIRIRDMAEMHDMPVPFLEQILYSLRKHGLVESRRGPNGGYILARNPSHITIGDAVRALDGPIAACECFQGGEAKRINSKRIRSCPISGVSKKLTEKLEAAFDSITLEEAAQAHLEIEGGTHDEHH